MIEGHPDNVSASLFGGITASFTIDSLMPFKEAWISGTKSDLFPLKRQLTATINIPYSNEVKVIAIIPDFQLPTSVARAALPESFPLESVVFNLQRISVLSNALKGDDSGNLNPFIIYEAMKDKIHQE